MTIRHMKIFLQVYQTQNVTQAARQLHMTQPAVSRAIQEIESYYGVCLFERIGRRLSVTEIGKQFYAQALLMMEAFERMEQGLRNWDALGTIRVGATVTCGNLLLPELVMRFQKTHPELQIRATVSNGVSLQKGLLYNRLDLALIEGSVGEPDLFTRRIGRDKLILIIPPGHPFLSKESVSLEELADCPVLLREPGSTVRTYLEQYFAVAGLVLNPVWESTSTQALVKAVGCGLGISFLPEQLVKKSIESGEVFTREIAGQELSRQYHLVWHKNKFLTGSMKNFIALCEEICG